MEGQCSIGAWIANTNFLLKSEACLELESQALTVALLPASLASRVTSSRWLAETGTAAEIETMAYHSAVSHNQFIE